MRGNIKFVFKLVIVAILLLAGFSKAQTGEGKANQTIAPRGEAKKLSKVVQRPALTRTFQP